VATIAAVPTPVAPDSSFASDNAAGVLPEVMAAIEQANHGPALAYGEDRWTAAAAAALDEAFGRHVESLLCWGGTGANVVGLASVLEPHQAVITPDSAHIVVDECGAPARFTGSSVLTVPAVDGKLQPESMEPFLHWFGSEHHAQPAVVSISQATEMGTVYRPDEIAAICELAHAHSMVVHLDGARIANALAATGTDLATMVVDTGVDLMTFGMTKNGAMYGEAVVFVRPELARRARYVRKQAGQLSSKSRFIAAQLLALLEDDRWLTHAAHANDMARRLAAGASAIEGVRLAHEPQVNSVFVHLPADAIEPLQQWTFFWDWDLTESLVRWMTSFDTTTEDVDRFLAGVDEVLAAYR
jgi:threonine aldolase